MIFNLVYQNLHAHVQGSEFFFCTCMYIQHFRHMHYWPSVTSKWMDIGHFLFFCNFIVLVKKNETNIQPSQPNKNGRYWFYHMAKKRIITCRTTCEIQVGKMGPSLPTQIAIRMQDSCHLAHTQIQSYNKPCYYRHPIYKNTNWIPGKSYKQLS